MFNVFFAKLPFFKGVIYSHNKYAYIHIYMFMQDTYWRNKLIRRSNKRHWKTSLTKYLPLTLLQGFEKVVWVFFCERELEIEHKLQYFDPSLLWPSRCVFLVLLMLNRRPRGSLCWVICYILSATSQVPKLHRGSRGPPRPGVAFPTTSLL